MSLSYLVYLEIWHRSCILFILDFDIWDWRIKKFKSKVYFWQEDIKWSRTKCENDWPLNVKSIGLVENEDFGDLVETCVEGIVEGFRICSVVLLSKWSLLFLSTRGLLLLSKQIMLWSKFTLSWHKDLSKESWKWIMWGNNYLDVEHF